MKFQSKITEHFTPVLIFVESDGRRTTRDNTASCIGCEVWEELHFPPVSNQFSPTAYSGALSSGLRVWYRRMTLCYPSTEHSAPEAPIEMSYWEERWGRHAWGIPELPTYVDIRICHVWVEESRVEAWCARWRRSHVPG